MKAATLRSRSVCLSIGIACILAGGVFGAINASANPAYDYSQEPGFDPIYHRLVLRNMWLQNHTIIESLDLSPEKKVQLFRLICTREEAVHDAREVAQSSQSLDEKGAAKAMINAYSSLTEEIRSLAGDTVLKQIDEAKLAITEQEMVDHTSAVDLALDGVPLSEEQQRTLGRIYYEAYSGPRKAQPDNYGQLPIDQTTGLNYIDQEILDRSSAILRKDQMDALRRSLVRERASMNFVATHGGVRMH